MRRVGAPKRTRKGTVSFRKPGRMRWEFEAPDKETIVSDGETLFSYDPDLNQVVETPLRQALKIEQRDLIPARDREYQPRLQGGIRESAGADGLIDLSLDAKTGGYKIEIGLDPKTLQPLTLTLTDQLGDVTRIDFSDVHDNVQMPESIFAVQSAAGRRHRHGTCLAVTYCYT